MTFRSILLSAAFAALPTVAFAHPGHIAAQGSGHSHLLGYVVLACAVAGIALWARARLAGRAKTSPQ